MVILLLLLSTSILILITIYIGDKLVRKPNASAPRSAKDKEIEDEAIVKEIARYVEAKIISDYGFVTIDVPEEEGIEISTTILASSDYETCSKLLIIIQNQPGCQLGIFSRTICLSSGLNAGTMLNFIQKARAKGYGVLILRPNKNSVEVIGSDNKIKKNIIPRSESPENHVLYVWENIVTHLSQVNHIVLLGYGLGASLCKDLLLRQMVRTKDKRERNNIKAFITVEGACINTAQGSQIIESDDGADVKKILKEIAINLECNIERFGTPLSEREKKLGVTTISLGLPPGKTEVDNVGMSYSMAEDSVIKCLALSEITPTLSKTFRETMEKENNIISTKRVEGDGGDDAPKSRMSQMLGSVASIFRGSPKKDEDRMLTVDDFELLKVVGKGAFGKVMLVRKKGSATGPGNGLIYAMKVLKKSVIIQKGQVEHTMSERDILYYIRHPFIVRLRFAFHNTEKLFLVTDYYNGGSLYQHIKKDKAFDETRAKFYAAELLLAISHLHGQNIIYRDLKLENVLMDFEGHIALTDFGLSKRNIDHTGGASTFCGTAEYIAPELIDGKSYGPPVDWWGFGILLFEMMHGKTPFYDKNRKIMFYKILKSTPQFPSHFSKEACDVIRGLLQVDEKARFGSGVDGYKVSLSLSLLRLLLLLLLLLLLANNEE